MLCLEAFGRIQGHDASLVDEGHPTAQLIGLFHIVGGQKDRHALRGQTSDDGANIASHVGVQAACRLVEKEHFRLMEQPPGDEQSLLHAVGVLFDLVASASGQPYLSQNLVHASLVHAIQSSGKDQVVAGRQALVDILVLKNHPDLRFELLALSDHIAASDPCRAVGGPQLSGQHANGGRLACAIGSQEAKNLAGFYSKADAVHRAQTIIVAGQIVNLNGFHRLAPHSSRCGLRW